MVETLIALGIFVVIVVAMGAFQANVFTNQRIASGSFQTAQDAQIILKKLIVELRSALAGANGAYPIVSASTSSLAFYADPGNDGTAERIIYSLVGTTLYRAVLQPTGNPPTYNSANQSTSTMMVNVRNSSSTPVFQYFDQNYTGTSSPLALPVTLSSVRLIKVSLTLDTNPQYSPAPRTYTTQISLRNLKTNL